MKENCYLLIVYKKKYPLNSQIGRHYREQSWPFILMSENRGLSSLSNMHTHIRILCTTNCTIFQGLKIMICIVYYVYIYELKELHINKYQDKGTF